MEERLGTQLLRVRTALDQNSSEAERFAALSALRDSVHRLASDRSAGRGPGALGAALPTLALAFPEVFLGDSGRFDVIVGNPPFLGGTKISESSGQAYRQHISEAIAGRPTDHADLVAFFMLRAATTSRRFGLLATNTVSQGDARGWARSPDRRIWMGRDTSLQELALARRWTLEDREDLDAGGSLGSGGRSGRSEPDRLPAGSCTPSRR